MWKAKSDKAAAFGSIFEENAPYSFDQPAFDTSVNNGKGMLRFDREQITPYVTSDSGFYPEGLLPSS